MTHAVGVRAYVLHLDLDQFIAAVEVLRRPELRGKPVVVGGDGDPTKRGVVSTASYEARAFGIRSGMALRTALKRCPDAVFLPVDFEAYNRASRTVMDTLRAFDAVVEEAGWDEAFLGVQTSDPEELARRIQRAVLERTQLWCTIGIGDNKLQAKIASGLGKPRGVFVLIAENWRELMDGMPTRELWGIGKKTSAKLQALGIRTVGELARTDVDDLARAFGPRVGPWLASLGRGEGPTQVSAEPWVAKARGRERTFQEDLTDPERVRAEILRLAREVVRDLEEEDRPAVRVVVKVRFAPFVTTTRGVPLDAPSKRVADVEAGALRALARFELDRPVRLLGVRAEMTPPA